MAKKDEVKDNVEVTQNSAVINPYALAELVAGRTIPWKELPDVPRVLEDILQMPYQELFDPKYGGPLYLVESKHYQPNYTSFINQSLMKEVFP